jgi:hypothetical protein
MIDSVDFPADESCPDCRCVIFRLGPQGGIARNIECTGCLSRFNITRWPYQNRRKGEPSPIIWAQRIPSEKDGGGTWREDWFPKVVTQ